MLITFVRRNRSSMGETIIGVFNIVWGLWLLNPYWDTFQYPHYSVLSLVTSEYMWGFLVLVLGFFTVLFSVKHMFRPRKVLMLINMVLWGFVSMSTALSLIDVVDMVSYGAISFLSFWHYMRLFILKGEA